MIGHHTNSQTLKRYLYSFGYETPTQRSLNLQRGWDDESSAQLLIRADDRDSAYALGRAIAEALVRRLFERAQTAEQPSWPALQYADFIADAPAEADDLEVAVHELPPIDWLHAHNNEA